MTTNDHSPNTSTTVTLLLLGDPGCGKSTFLSRLKTQQSRMTAAGRPDTDTSGTANTTTGHTLRDTDQPFIYDIKFSKKSFTLEVYDTSSPNEHWSRLRPDVIVLGFDLTSRESLDGLRGWRNDITRYFQHGVGERIPVMMLGLKRDARVEEEGVIYPQEAYRVAQELRCDRYAECSAVTGELLAETFEDVARMAAMTTTDRGGQSAGACVLL